MSARLHSLLVDVLKQRAGNTLNLTFTNARGSNHFSVVVSIPREEQLAKLTIPVVRLADPEEYLSVLKL